MNRMLGKRIFCTIVILVLVLGGLMAFTPRFVGTRNVEVKELVNLRTKADRDNYISVHDPTFSLGVFGKDEPVWRATCKIIWVCTKPCTYKSHPLPEEFVSMFKGRNAMWRSMGSEHSTRRAGGLMMPP